jgi:hypothetical protein
MSAFVLVFVLAYLTDLGQVEVEEVDLLIRLKNHCSPYYFLLRKYSVVLLL